MGSRVIGEGGSDSSEGVSTFMKHTTNALTLRISTGQKAKCTRVEEDKLEFGGFYKLELFGQNDDAFCRVVNQDLCTQQ